MKPYYSIVSIATNPALNEKFNIGLLCIAANTHYFHFSPAKFKIVKNLLSDNGAKLALAALKGIEQEMDQLHVETIFKHANRHSISEGYLTYLSRYNNNLIQFSAPVEIDLAINTKLFQALFQKFIYSEEQFEPIQKKALSAFSSRKKSFQTKAKEYANIDFSVSNDVIDNLLIPVKVDVFGKNGVFVTGQAVDFSKGATTLQHDISSYLYLVEHTKQTEKNSSCYILGSEPSSREKEQHQIWNTIRKSNLIEFVDLDESEKVIEEMKKRGVKPVFFLSSTP